ncbi:ribosome assembly protein METTL17, mitochondrial [Pleurodeles waltl]|uniref:ribosome assembly protein METTL17, mitochondrial n=1 Tax=Pleurodeles waltl TaxID=8319 RepID=UPI003709C1BD
MPPLSTGGAQFRALKLSFRNSFLYRGFGVALPDGPQVDNTSQFLQGVPHRQHPGILKLKKVTLPPNVIDGAQVLVQKCSITRLEERCHALTHYLWSRKRPVEDRELQSRAIELEKRLRVKMAPHSSQDLQADKSEEALKEALKQSVMATLRKNIYHWQQLRYDKELGVLYLAARFAGVHAAVSRAFHEIRKRVPEFSPQTLLDFGSGTGSVTWAAHAAWGRSIREYMCVDSSAEMNELSELLLRGGSLSHDARMPGVYFRQFLPVSPKVGYDLVVSAYSLNELPSQQDRTQMIQTLWRKTDGFLVLIENGTKEGHQMLMEARDAILKLDEEQENKVNRGGHIFAPCPHSLPCPLLAKTHIVPCNFIQAYQPLPFSWNPNTMWEKFSFLIMRRGPGEDVEQWPRITQPILRRPRHVHCRICCPDGMLQHMVVTAHRHGRDLYRCARNSEWGDRLPMIIPSGDAESVVDDTSPGSLQNVCLHENQPPSSLT